jgi:hypothetical protein
MSSGDTKYKYKSIVLSAGGSPTPASTSSSSLDSLKKLTSGEDSNVNKIPSLKVKYPNSIIQYANNGRYFQYSVDGKSLTQKGSWKIENGKIVKINDGASGTTSAKKSVPNVTDKNLLSKLNFAYKFPGDEKYVYAYSSPENALKEDTAQTGKWYAKNLATGKVFDITTN